MLPKIIPKSPKYRDCQNFGLKQVKEKIINGIDDCIFPWCQRKDI